MFRANLNRCLTKDAAEMLGFDTGLPMARGLTGWSDSGPTHSMSRPFWEDDTYRRTAAA
jgi:hypothetical protein